MQSFEPDEFAAQLRAGFPLINDHPDIAGVLRQPDLLGWLGAALTHRFRDAGITKVAAPEARGPILGALAATALNAGLVVVRKLDRNHPGADIELESSTTWRGHTETFQARSFDLSPDDRVLIVDDWITTGSSIRAVADFVEQAGATCVGSSVVVNKADGQTIAELRTGWLVRFDELMP